MSESTQCNLVLADPPALAYGGLEGRILNVLPSVLAACRRDWTIVFWSPCAGRILGIPAGTAIGRKLSELGLSWSFELISDGAGRCSRETRHLRLPDLPFRGPSGHEGLLGLTMSLSEGEDGDDLLILSGSEITERRRNRSQMILVHKLEALGQLAAGVAHEINTPTQYVSDNTLFLKESFAALVGLMQSMQNALEESLPRLSPTQAQELAEAIQKADLDYLLSEIPLAIDQSLEGLNRVAEIVRAMKQFSHPDQETPYLTDLNKSIHSTVTISRNEWKYCAELELDLAPNLPLVLCRAGLIRQVLLNLVVNAAQAISETADQTNRKGRITISSRLIPGAVAISVSDTGPGVPEEIRDRIFDPFFTTKEPGKGTGQGLALAHHVVVQIHKGRIELDCGAGQGATFRVILPLQGS